MFSGFSLFPPQAASLAPEIDNLYLGVVTITAFFAVVVVVCITYFAIKYRDPTGDKVGAPITGSVPLELGWSLIPFVISIGIFVWASVVFFHIVRAPDQMGADPIPIECQQAGSQASTKSVLRIATFDFIPCCGVGSAILQQEENCIERTR